jgi:hypothetical protein
MMEYWKNGMLENEETADSIQEDRRKSKTQGMTSNLQPATSHLRQAASGEMSLRAVG